LLLEAAQAWLADRGCGTVRGPVSPSMKGEFGVLVSGHQDPPYVMMAYTPAYYDTLLGGLGFQVAKTFYAFRYDSDVLSRTQAHYDDVSRVCERIAQRHPELRVRTIDRRHLTREIHRVNQLANRVRIPVWGFVPLTDAELEHMANQLRRVLDPRLFVVAERDDELVGHMVAVPDPNWALWRTVGSADVVRIPQVLFWLRRTPRVRFFAMGAHEKYRHAGVTALLLKRVFDEAVSWVKEAELSWVVEDNVRSLRAIQRLMPAKQYKSYRLYDRSVEPF
jgi:GNAT superfamily N-acetyltransferase